MLSFDKITNQIKDDLVSGKVKVITDSESKTRYYALASDMNIRVECSLNIPKTLQNYYDTFINPMSISVFAVGDIVRYAGGNCTYRVVDVTKVPIIIKSFTNGREYSANGGGLVLIKKAAAAVKSYDPVKIIFNKPATIMFFADGTKIVSKVAEGEEWNEYIGVQACILKRILGSKEEYNRLMKVARSVEQRTPEVKPTPEADNKPAPEKTNA